MTCIYISVGSNICPRENIPPALDDLYRHFGTLTLSRVYESEAVGFDGDNFLNFVVACNSTLSLLDTAAVLRKIELAHGRAPNAQKFSSRTVDLDLLLFGERQCQQPLVLPRPEIRFNAFVLWPLAELAPELVIPGDNLPLSQRWQDFDKTQQKLWPVPFHWSPSGDTQ